MFSEDAIYPMNLADNAGQPLNGASNYTIHFHKEAIPPAEGFWSITLYDQQGCQVANGLNRFAVSSWTPFKYNPDGSLDLYLQKREPVANEGGELAARTEGPIQRHYCAFTHRRRMRSPANGTRRRS
jgi:hypothetical protein